MRTMQQIIEANKRAGHYFFAASTMDAWQSKTTDSVYNAGSAGTVFVISEQIDNLPRRYRPCLSRPDGIIDPLMMILEAALTIEDGRRLAEIAARLLRAGASLVIVEDRLRAAVK